MTSSKCRPRNGWSGPAQRITLPEDPEPFETDPPRHQILDDADVLEGALRVRCLPRRLADRLLHGHLSLLAHFAEVGDQRRNGSHSFWRSDRGNMIYFEAPVVEN